MIYITGDTHIPVDVKKLNTKSFPAQKELTENDFLIILGDFGGVWDNGKEDCYWRKWFNSKNFTTLFIDGNHENFDLLKTFPEVDFHGGKAHKISDKIFHLMRGQVFELDNKKFFALGGASSHDKEYRTEGKTWWREEMPSDEEYETALTNLDKAGWCVDYVITHCTATSVQNEIASSYQEDKLTDFLEEIKTKLKYDKWFFGHYHQDKDVSDKHIAVFDSIIRI